MPLPLAGSAGRMMKMSVSYSTIPRALRAALSISTICRILRRLGIELALGHALDPQIGTGLAEGMAVGERLGRVDPDLDDAGLCGTRGDERRQRTGGGQNFLHGVAPGLCQIMCRGHAPSSGA